jgi:hypothetical protein
MREAGGEEDMVVVVAVVVVVVVVVGGVGVWGMLFGIFVERDDVCGGRALWCI